MELCKFMVGILLVSAITKCSAINCLECSDVPNPAVCNKVVTCPDDSNCLVKQYITTSGALLYSSSCISKQGCSALRTRDVDMMAEDETKDILTCQECCDSHDYCNIQGCSSTFVDRTQRGPYCFECNVENDVFGCRTTQLCDQAYECQNTQTGRPGGSADIIGKRSDPDITITLPYCCKGDFCNDIRMFVNNASMRVDGTWTAWNTWSSCSKSCGYGGEERRSRSCDNPPPQNGGSACVGDGNEVRDCMVQACPIDGGWSAWGSWSSCALTCGTNAQQTRSKTCDNPRPQYSGAFCQGDYMETNDCGRLDCPVDGGWSSWGGWTQCSQTCGSGTNTRHRSCNNPAPAHNGKDCDGLGETLQFCTAPTPCPVNGGWSPWSNYTQCSHTCGTGRQSKQRSCTNPVPAFNGTDCHGIKRYTQHCRSHTPCPVDGGWSSWGGWTQCSQTCGSGTNTRHRSCNNPAPTHNGKDCDGLGETLQFCTAPTPCPVNGGWSPWSNYTQCSHTCGTGRQSKQRSCTNPVPAFNGTDCHGIKRYTQHCRSHTPCPVDGGWSSWGGWSQCSHTCGSGTHTRHRGCNNPAPAHNGKDCVGLGETLQFCTAPTLCPVDGGWSSWGGWTQCSHTCGSGTHARHRSCTRPVPAHNGKDCGGSATDDQHCTAPTPCPVDGGWSSWSGWTQCSQTCGSGMHTRHRSCTHPAPAHNGKDCGGSATDDQHCTARTPCPGSCTTPGFETVENGHDLCVQVFTHGKSWAEARKTCQHYPHGDLVVIPHLPNIHNLQQFLLNKHIHAGPYWIGRIAPVHQELTWVNNDRVMTDYQLDGALDKHARCGLLTVGQLLSYHCETQHPFVCQINMQ